MLTSVGPEGTRKGFDNALIRGVSTQVGVPVIASGGMGKPEDLIEAVEQGEADAIAMADILHYKRATLGDIRQVAQRAGMSVRKYAHI